LLYRVCSRSFTVNPVILQSWGLNPEAEWPPKGKRDRNLAYLLFVYLYSKCGSYSTLCVALFAAFHQKALMFYQSTVHVTKK
jgi:hypothetical protein